MLNMNRIVQHIWQGIREHNTESLCPVFDTQRPLLSTADMRPWYTLRPCERTQKSHISHAVYDSRWEGTESFELDHNHLVDAWVKNDHLGFEILYTFRGVIRKYRPDFLIRLTNGTMLVVEVKGEETDETDAKHAFMREWIAAVNADGGFGTWAFAMSTDPDDLQAILVTNNDDSR